MLINCFIFEFLEILWWNTQTVCNRVLSLRSTPEDWGSVWVDCRKCCNNPKYFIKLSYWLKRRRKPKIGWTSKSHILSCFRRFCTLRCWPTIVHNSNLSSQIVYLCLNRYARQLVLCRIHFQNGEDTGADPAGKSRGAISVIFCSEVSLRVHYCKRHKVYFTTLLCNKTIDGKMTL